MELKTGNCSVTFTELEAQVFLLRILVPASFIPSTGNSSLMQLHVLRAQLRNESRLLGGRWSITHATEVDTPTTFSPSAAATTVTRLFSMLVPLGLMWL